MFPIQKANGLNLKMSGASYSALMSGMILGYIYHPKAVRNHEKALAAANKKYISKKIMEAKAVRKITFIFLWPD